MPFAPDLNRSPRDPDTFSRHRQARSSPESRERSEIFGPSASDILRNLRGGRDKMFFNDCFFGPEQVFVKADEGGGGGDDGSGNSGMSFRGRHPHPHSGFPGWMEDHDMTDLAHRMSHAPHFATVGRRGSPAGPWRERRHSGGSGRSGASEEDCLDGSHGPQGGSEQPPVVPHEIPIMFEAPPPPSTAPTPPQSELDGGRTSQQCPVRTTSAVDATENGNSATRAARCASAPPEMAEQQQQQQQQQQQEQPQQQRFVSKISITPQTPPAPQGKASPPYSPLPAKFNTVPRPFVPEQQQQQQQPPQQYPQQYQQYPNQYPNQYQQPPLGFFPPGADPQWQYQQQQYPAQQTQQEAPQQRPAGGGGGGGSGQRPSVVRNIPIFVEGRDDPVEQDTRSAPAPQPQWTQIRPQTQPQPQPQPQPTPAPTPAPTPTQKPKQRRQQAHQPTPPPQQPIPHAVPMPMPEHHATPPPQPPQPETQPQPQPQAQPQHTATPPPAPPQPQPARDPRMVEIERVHNAVSDLASKVSEFKGTKKDREFLYLDEMLTRALLQLDNVVPDGCDEVRQARKAVIREINSAISKLESMAKDPASTVTQDPSQIPSQGASEVPQGDGTNQDSAPVVPQQVPVGDSKQEQQMSEKMEVEQKVGESSVNPAETTADSADPPPPPSEVSS